MLGWIVLNVILHLCTLKMSVSAVGELHYLLLSSLIVLLIYLHIIKMASRCKRIFLSTSEHLRAQNVLRLIGEKKDLNDVVSF